MEIEYLILADSAQVAEGKLYVLGAGWDRLAVNALPAVHLAGFAISALVPWSETNQPHALTLTVEDEDGSEVLPPVAINVEVGRPSGIPVGSDQRVMIAFGTQLQLPRLGRYVAALRAGGETRKRVSFTVLRGPQFRE